MTVAVDAMHSASNPHAFMGVTEQGLAAIVKTRGNQDVHVILRGGTKGPNYSEEHIRDAVKQIEKARKGKGFASVMVDCSRTYTSLLLPFTSVTHHDLQTVTLKKTISTNRKCLLTSASNYAPRLARMNT